MRRSGSGVKRALRRDFAPGLRGNASIGVPGRPRRISRINPSLVASLPSRSATQSANGIFPVNNT